MAAKPQPARPPKNVFGLAIAKARLSELIERAQTQGPQQIQRRGRPAAYLVSAQEWERRTTLPKQTLGDFFRNSPIYRCGLEFDRDSGTFRDVDA